MITRKKRKRRANKPVIRIVNSLFPEVSVVIPAMNERKTIARVIREASRIHPDTEVIVVVNGSRDGTDIVASRTGARVIAYPRPLGHDVGRAVGARAAKGDIVLFLDGDFIVPASRLKPLIEAIRQGADIALNQYLGKTDTSQVHSVVLAKHALNIALLRHDLKGASLTTIPHAMNRRALDTIGVDYLTVPPVAQARAIRNGLRIQAVRHIDVGKPNPRRRLRRGKDPLEKLIVGDHLEALHWFLAETDDRGHRTDLNRQRQQVR